MNLSTSASSSDGKPGQPRRNFIKQTTLASASAAAASQGLLANSLFAQNQAPSVGVIGANERIAVAYVGVGKQGMAHLRHQKKHAGTNNIRQAAVCDVYDKHLRQAQVYLGLDDRNTYRDHRKIMDRKDIDAVVVSTVDNWHADVAIDAMESGKHVYGEKPMARYLNECFRMYDTVKRTGAVFQIGSQFCAAPIYHQAAQWIREGRLGPLVWGQGSYCRNNKRNSEWTFPNDPDASPDNLDWNRWLGKAAKIPFNPDHYFSWHKYYAYNSGILGNLLPHRMLPLMLATGNPEYPKRVVCTGSREISTDREITDTTHVLAEFPSGFTLVLAGTTVNEQGLEDIIRGRQGTLYFATGQNKLALRPERVFADEIDSEDFNSGAPFGSVPELEKNWFDCIRSGKEPVGNVDLSIKAHTVLCLAEMSERLGLSLSFDPETRRITTGNGKLVEPISYQSDAPIRDPKPLA